MRLIVGLIVMFAASASQAQTIPLSCQGEFKVYRPSRTDAEVPAGAGSVDLDRKRFNSPVGNFRISSVYDDRVEIQDAFVETSGRRMFIRGNFDRSTGRVWIMWFTEHGVRQFDANQNGSAEMYAAMQCRRANRVF